MSKAVRATLRFDKLVWHLRLAKTRSAAAAVAERGVARVNGRRVEKAHCPVAVGDVLTVPQGTGERARVRVVRVLALPRARLGAAALGGMMEELGGSEPEPPTPRGLSLSKPSPYFRTAPSKVRRRFDRLCANGPGEGSAPSLPHARLTPPRPLA